MPLRHEWNFPLTAAMETLLGKDTPHGTSRYVLKIVTLDISNCIRSAGTDDPTGFATLPDPKKLLPTSPRCLIIVILLLVVFFPGTTGRRCMNVEALANFSKGEILASKADNTRF